MIVPCPLISRGTDATVPSPKPVSSDVTHALLSLGYSDKEAMAAVKQLPEGLSVSEGIRQALRSLSKA